MALIKGHAYNDYLVGTASNDTINGAAGADLMYGYAGDDTFLVDDVGDQIYENSNEGTDTVKTTLTSYSLSSVFNIENLIYAGSANFNGTGSASANNISSGKGNDTLNGAGGNDSLYGSAGNDTYIVNNTGVTITDTAGIDTFNTSSFTNFDLSTLSQIENLTYTGTLGFTGLGNNLNNVITGGTGADSITAGLGNDTLVSGGGADSLVGGVGNDTYVIKSLSGLLITEEANEGNDAVASSVLTTLNLSSFTNIENLSFLGTSAFNGTGDGKANVITGNIGNDTLDGGVGIDTLIGGEGNDTYIVDDFKDLVTEQTFGGDDTVKTSLASYSIAKIKNLENLTYIGISNFKGNGNKLDNAITGGVANDTLIGDSGNDTLIGAGGNDSLDGGSGNDTYVINNTGVFINDASGIDTFKTSTLTNVDLTNFVKIENITYIGSSLFTGIGNKLNNVITGGVGADSLSGGLGNDTLLSSGGSDTLIGGIGNDTYVINSMSGLVITEGAGDGIDTVSTATLSTLDIRTFINIENAAYTGSAAFTGIGDANANVITGNTGNDSLDGGAGLDTLNGGDGNDTLKGGGEADALLGGKGNDTYLVDNVSVKITDVDGIDKISTALLTSFDLNKFSTIENLSYTGAAAFTGIGNKLNNVIQGSSAADSLNGGLGNDTLMGNGGADTLIGDQGDDTFVLTNADVTIIEKANAGKDTVSSSSLSSLDLKNFSNIENIAYNGSSAFTGVGDAADNVLQGGTGADTLTGNNGNDTLIGGGGSDTLIGGLGDDVFMFGNSNVSITEDTTGGTDTINTTASTLNLAAFSNIENLIYSGLGSFTGYGSIGDNSLIGGNGPDTLDGMEGNDTLFGGTGNDSLTGGFGNDRLKASLGNDTLTGSGGNDIFDFNEYRSSNGINGIDKIADFHGGEDKIDIDATHLSAMKATTVVTFAGASSGPVSQTVKTGYIEIYVNDNANTTEQLYHAIDAVKTFTTNYPQDPIANGLALVTVASGLMAGTYLLLNDAKAAVTMEDTLINLSNLTYDDLHTPNYTLDMSIFI